jgi:glycosyltransferase involved in cell wall biosynthesis
MSATASSAPLVSVLIPVYNGEEFIANAIGSVLRQTYPNFTLTIVNNRSTDRTREIAADFAGRDSRVRIHDNEKFLTVVENHNQAFALVSPDAKYAKILGADDWLFPNCLEELVRVADANPNVGMVTSFVLSGTRVAWDGLPDLRAVVPGRMVCRLRLLDGIKVFGGPSASLIRASIVREKRPFYPTLNYHGDNEAYLDLLRDHDFGYVHQVLSYNRKGEASRTTAYLDRVNSHPAADLHEMLTFGPVYLSANEYAVRLAQVTDAYYRSLARSLLEFRNREFWDYHLIHMKRLGVRVSYWRLALYACGFMVDALLNPKRTIESGLRRIWPARSAAPRPTPGVSENQQDAG